MSEVRQNTGVTKSRQLRNRSLVLLVAALATFCYPAAAQEPEERVVRELAFRGNRALDDLTLSAFIATSPSSWAARYWWVRWLGIGEKRYLDEAQLRRDAVRLLLVYRQIGYMDVTVDTLVRRDPQNAFITFVLYEGAPVRVTRFELRGLEGVIDTARMRNDLPLRVGDPFNRWLFQASADTIGARLRRVGFPYAQVLRSFDADAGSLRAEVSLEAIPGPRMRIGTIELQGLAGVSPRTVRRLLPIREGQFFDEDRLVRAQRELYDLGVFRYVDAQLLDTLPPEDPADSLVDLRIRVEEGKRHRVRAGLGYGTEECFRGQAGWSMGNFFGGGRTLDVTARTAMLGVGHPSDGLGVGSALCRSLRDDFTSDTMTYAVGAAVRQPGFPGGPHVTSVGLFTERRAEPRAYVRQGRGANVGVTFNARSRLPVAVTYSYSIGSTTAPPGVYCSVFQACTEQDRAFLAQRRAFVGLAVTAVRRRTDTPVDPTKGSLSSVTLLTTSPVIGSDPFFSFSRGEASIAWYRRVGRRQVLAWRVWAGAILPRLVRTSSDAARYVPPEHRLYAGGPNSVRGFSANGLGPLVYVTRDTTAFDTLAAVRGDTIYRDLRTSPTGGSSALVLNAELRVPAPVFKERMQLTFFADVGQVWDEPQGVSFSLSSLRVTPGVGLRFTTPLGPVRIDAGYNGYQPQAGALYFETDSSIARIRGVLPRAAAPVLSAAVRGSVRGGADLLMVRRSLGGALWGIVGLLACGLGVHQGLTGTASGRAFLANLVRSALGRVLVGRVEVAEVGGTLVTGVWLRDVRIFDPHGTPVAVLPRVVIAFNPFDVGAGRYVAQSVRLERPEVYLEEHAHGRLNVAELVRPRTAPPGTGPAPLILLRDVTVTGGTVTLRLLDDPSPGDATLEIERDGPEGRRRVRRFTAIDARLASLRLSTPREPGIGIDISQLAVDVSDPPIALRGVRGRATLHGDSVDLALGHVALPRTGAAVAGTIAWPRDTVLFALDVTADSVTLSDLRFVDARFPEDAVFRGEARVRSRSGRDLAVTLDPLDLRHAGGRVRGRLTAVSRAGVGLAVIEGATLETDRFDLEFARPYVDTLPFAGRLTGRTIAVGTLDALALDIDWDFRDSLVAGWPATRLKGRGEVSLGSEAGLGFREFELDEASVDLGTVRRLVPPVELVGVIEGSGIVDGTVRDAVFTGTLRHRDGAGPVSEARGRFRVDSRRDTLAVDVDAIVAPLALAGLRGSFPGLPLTPALTGTISLTGGLDSLATRANLSVPRGGALHAEGILTLLPSRRGVRAMAVRGTDLNLANWLPDAPPSRLTFAARLDLQADSGVAPEGALSLSLAPSRLVDTPLDSGLVVLRLAGGRMVVDSLSLVQPGLRTEGRGALGLAAPETGSLDVVLDADSLAPLDSLGHWIASRLGLAPDSGALLEGSARATLTLRGALDSLSMRAEGSARDVRWRDWYVRSGSGTLALERASAARVTLSGSLDSLAYGRMGFGAASWRLAGRSDSLDWFVRSRVGELGAVLGGGRAARDTAGFHVVADSLALLMPGGVWLLAQPTELVLADSVARVTEAVFRSFAGTGRIALAAHLPAHGPIAARLDVEGVPVAGVVALLQYDTVGVGGEIHGAVAVTGIRQAPLIEGTFALRDLAVEGFRVPLVDGRVGYGERTLQITGAMWRGERRLLDLDARFPVDLALASVPQRRMPAPLSIRIGADAVDLSAVEFMTQTLRGLTGTVSADVRVEGTWERPQLDGTVEIRDAGATMPALNARYVGIVGRLSLAGDTIRIDSLSARSGEGSASVRGHVRLENLTRPILSVAIAANRFTALDLRNRLSATVSGRVRLDGPVYGATLTGQGTVTDGVWYFRDAVAKRVIDLDEPWVRALIDTTVLADPRLRTEFSSRFLNTLRIRDLDLTMGSSVWLRSTEANIQLTDNVTVAKEEDVYRLRGTLRAPRGTYRLVVGPVTREFVVTQGTVRYFGTPDLDAALDIEARHVVNPVPLPGRETADRITVVAHIGGTLLVPRLTLRAEGRELPEAAVISYLMFGIPSLADVAGGEAGSTQRYLVQSAASGLVSGELSRALISDLGVPLDYVEIRPGSPSDPISGALLAAGWQIGPRTFLVVNAGFCEGRPVSLHNTLGASLQYRFGPAWRTEASFEPLRTCNAPAVEGQTQSVVRQLGLDLLWEKRF